jgi:uncharacterized protein Smg (DUF494 family)
VEDIENKVIDIIIYLAQYAKSNQGKVGDLVKVFKNLIELGFSEEEIKKAYLWFLNKPEKFSKLENEKSNLCGWLKGFKEEYFTSESYGFLYQIEELGLLDRKEIEILISKSMVLGKEKVDLETIKNLANLLFFSDNSLRKNTTGFFWVEQESI